MAMNQEPLRTGFGEPIRDTHKQERERIAARKEMMEFVNGKYDLDENPFPDDSDDDPFCMFCGLSIFNCDCDDDDTD